jgi:hypothetical protein
MKYVLSLIALLSSPALAADALNPSFLKSNETVNVREYSWTRADCTDILAKVVGVDILEGPPSLSIKTVPSSSVKTVKAGCTREVTGGQIAISSGAIPAKFDGIVTYRLRVLQTDGLEGQWTGQAHFLLFP